MQPRKKSQFLFSEAQKRIPGGVNSPVRAFRGVDGEPIFIQCGKGPYLIDVDGQSYIDYVGSWGPLIVGHAHPYVVEKVSNALTAGFGFGAPTEIEVQLAEKVCTAMPSLAMVRFVNSGTEAAMSAIRLARGFTGRDKILKFAGCYHGHADSLLVSAGSGALTFGVPNSAGIPAALAAETLVAEYNQLEEVAALFAKYGDEIAAVIVEPVAANMNCVLPLPGFLSGLRQLCDAYGSVLIFDEVITGFRLGWGGAQAYYNVTPDLTILGKIVGGGFPVGAFGGRADIMQTIAPLGPVYQAGTLSGNPVAMAAGLATLELLSAPNFYQKLFTLTTTLVDGLQAEAKRAHLPFKTAKAGALFGFCFSDAEAIHCEADVKNCDLVLFKQFFHCMLAQHVYFAPSAFEAGFVSAAHTQEEVDRTLRAVSHVFKQLQK